MTNKAAPTQKERKARYALHPTIAAYLEPWTPPTTPTQAYIASLSSNPLPTATELHALCTALHAALVDTPEMLWMTHSFEDMADVLAAAQKCIDYSAGDAADAADYYRDSRRDEEFERRTA